MEVTFGDWTDGWTRKGQTWLGKSGIYGISTQPICAPGLEESVLPTWMVYGWMVRMGNISSYFSSDI
jgi:hypothetical protein